MNHGTRATAHLRKEISFVTHLAKRQTERLQLPYLSDDEYDTARDQEQRLLGAAEWLTKVRDELLDHE